MEPSFEQCEKCGARPAQRGDYYCYSCRKAMADADPDNYFPNTDEDTERHIAALEGRTLDRLYRHPED